MDSNHRYPVEETPLCGLPPFHPRNSPSATKTDFFATGTDGSNPSPSSGESAANLVAVWSRPPDGIGHLSQHSAERGERFVPVIDEDLLQDFNVKYVGALRCSRAVIPFMKMEGWGRIINISGANARNAGNLSGGARNSAMVHMTKTLAVQLGRHGITVNCIHPGTTRTERTPSLLAARATQLGVSPEDAERQDFAPDSPRGNAICRMVDASEIAFVAVFLASDKAWAVSGELVAATGGAGRTVFY